MRISLFAGAYDTVPKPADLDWADFCAQLFPSHFFVETPPLDPYCEALKVQQKAFSPCEFRLGQPKSIKNALRVSLGVVDLDDVSTAQLRGVLETVESLGLAALLYTTWKHGAVAAKDLWRARLCVPFSKPVEKDVWALFWGGFCARLNAPADTKCKNIDRIYFGPFAPKGTEATAHIIRFEGQPLDVDTIPLVAPTMAQQRAAGVTGVKIPRERLEKLARKWAKSSDERKANQGECLVKVCRGEVFAEAGNRDTTIFQLAQDLAKTFPDADMDHLAGHFAQSLQIMGSDAPSVDDVAYKLERAQDMVQVEEAQDQATQVIESRQRIREAFDGTATGRDTPYTEPELEAFAAKAKCTREEFRKRWIIQRGTQYYINVAGKYSPAYGDRDVMNAVVRDLAPAISAGVELWHAPNGDPVRKTLLQLMSEYGSVAQNYVLDLRAQEAAYDSAQRLFTEAPCPIRQLTPTYDHDVAHWLEILAGGHYHDLCTWIALLTSLDETCAALMLTGRPGTGKSLLAMGLARIWNTEQPTALESAMSGFNDQLAKCPLLFADESLPKDFRGYGRTAELRLLIAAKSRPFKKKYAHESAILGAIRLIVAANNEDILAIQENLSTNDIEAIGDRFYHIPVKDEAKDFLELLKSTGDLKRFVDGDAIAKHALWLRDNHRFERAGRFLVKSPDREFYRALTTKTGIRSAVCQWLVGYLKDPRRVDGKGDYLVRVRRGQLLVTAQGVLRDWATYVPNEAIPTMGKLSQALSGLAGTKRLFVDRPRTTAMHYRAVETEHLYAWTRETEYASREEIDRALQVDTEERVHVSPTLLAFGKLN